MNIQQGNLSSRFCVGRSETGELQYVDYSKVSNPHMLFDGQSGTGKSYRIRHTMDELHGMHMTQHVIEFHPDFGYENFASDGAIANITPDSICHFDFQYATGNASINPLKMIDTNPDSGGVYSVSQDVVEAVKIWAPSMGPKQQGYLNRILHDVYAQKGIIANDTSTWHQARHNSPDFIDIQKYIRQILRAKRTGLSTSVFTEIDKLRKQAERQSRKVRSENIDSDFKDIEDNDLVEKINQLKDKTSQMIDQLVEGKDTSQYYSDWDISTLNSLADIVDSIVASGLFTRTAIAPQARKINVYRISKLSPTHQRVMTYLLLKRLYVTSMLTCKQLNPRVPTTYITADEGRYVQDAAAHPMSPMNLIFGGSRKFGMGMLVGVQGPHQLSKDMSDNFATKFILKSDVSADADAKKYFNLNKSQMAALIPKHNAWFLTGGKPTLIVNK